MANFDGFGAFIRTNSKKAVDTAKEVANVTKIKADIKAEELKMDSTYVAIGKLFCTLAAGEIDPEFIPLLQKIADSKEKISNLQAELDAYKKSVTCPECGKKIEDEEIAKKLIELDKEMANLGEDISDEDR